MTSVKQRSAGRDAFGSSSGLTILEVMVALAIIAIAFLALAMAQITNLKATVRTQAVTELKAAANRVLEQRMADVLEADIVVNPMSEAEYDAADTYKDGGGNIQTRYLKFWFLDYYHECSDPPRSYSGSRTLRHPDCEPDTKEDFGNVTVMWEYAGRPGITGEGLLDIVVTATHDEGAELTIGDVVSCYDVYPSPSSELPVPCPTPAGAGG